MLLSELCTRKPEESSSFELEAHRPALADVYERLVLGRKAVERAYNPKRILLLQNAAAQKLYAKFCHLPGCGHYLDGQEQPQESSGRDNNRSGPRAQEDTSIFTKKVMLHQWLNRDRHQLGRGTGPLLSERDF